MGNLKDIRRRAAERKAKREKENLQRQNIQTTITTDNAQQTAIDNNYNRAENELAKAQEVFDNAFDNAFATVTPKQRPQSTNGRMNVPKQYQNTEIHRANRMYATDGNMDFGKSDEQLGITTKQLQKGYEEDQKRRENEQNEMYQYLQQLKKEYYDNAEIGGLYDNTIRKLLNDSETLYNAPKLSNDSSKGTIVEDFKNFGKGLKDKVTSEDFLTVGISDARDAYNLNRVSKSYIDKYNTALQSTKDEQEAARIAFSQLSKAEKGVMLAMQLKTQIEQSRQGNTSLAYTAAGITGDMLPFALQLMASAGIGDILNAGAKATAKQVSKNSAKQIGKALSNKWVKNTETAIINTAISPMTHSDFANERFNARIQEHRELTGKEKAKITARNFFENITETVGGELLKDTGKITGRFVQKQANKIPVLNDIFSTLSKNNSEWQRFLNTITDNKVSRTMREKGYIGNFAEEYGEEGLVAVLNTAFGSVIQDEDMKQGLKEFVSSDNQKVLLLSLLVGTSAMPAVSGSIGFVSQNKNLQEYRKAKEKFSNQLTSLGFDGKSIISAIEISIGNGDFNQYAIKRDLKQSLQGYGIKDTSLFDMDKAINDYTEKAGKVKDVMQELDNRIRLMGENEKDLFFEDLSKELRRQAQNNILYHNIKEGYYFPMTDIQTGKKENYLAQVQSKDGALGFVIRKFKDENGNVIFRVKNDAGVVRDMTIEDIRQENIGGKYENELITFTKVSQVLDYLQTQADNRSSLKTEIELRNLLADYIEIDSEGSQTVNTGLTTDERQIFINNINQETGTVTGLVQNEYGYEREQLNISDIATMQPQNIDDIILSTNLIFDNINQENDIPDFEQKTQQHFIDELKNNYHKNKQEHFKKGNRIRLKVKDGVQIPEILQQNEKEGVIERADNDSIQVRFDNGEIRIYPIDNNNYYFENISDNATEDKVISDNNGINEKQNDKESQGIKNKIKSGEIYNNDIENTYDELLKVLENTEDTDLFINNKIEQLNNIMSKVKNPKTADIERIKRARLKTDNLKSNISYWQKVKQIPVIREQNKDYQVRKVQEEQRQKEETKQKKTIQKNIIEKSGINNIRQKFEKTKQITGHKGTKTLSDGEKIIGRYILIESTGLTPSHDIEKNFIQSEGFPTREDGTTLNDRDYQKDKQAQEQVRQKADKYDGRAVNDMPIADNNGIILSGNDRTMAGQLAGKQNTDTSYLESLKENAKQYGFTKEDINTMQHPRLVFVLDEDMNYTTENFAKFNHNEKKSQNNVEKAVKVGKTIKEDSLRKIAKVIAEFESIAECLRDKNGTSDIIDLLVNDGQIHRNDVAGFLNDGVFNEAGKEYIQTILVGATLNETSVRQVNTLPFMRNSILSALNEILVNNNLKEYSLKEELDGAINTVYEAHKHSEGKQGEDLKAYYTQLGLFGENNLKSKTTMMLADRINSVKINDLKTCLNSYNKAAGESANGDVDMFSGKVKSKEDILTDVLEGLDHTEKRNKKLQYILTEKKDYINKKEEPTNDKQKIENEQRKEEKIVSQTDISRKEDSNDTVTQDKQQKKDNRTSETVRQQKIYDKELFFRKNLAENIHTYLFYFKGKDEKIFRPYSFSDNSTVTSLMYASLIKRENVENVLRQILPILKETSICQVRDAKGNIYFDSSEQKLKAKQDNSNKNKLVTEDDYEKLKKRMKTKMQGQLNMGIDPEILEIGIQMAVYHIERGTRKFIDYAKAMIKDVGDNIRPYLKSFYNGARDLPEMTELSKEMDSYEEVNKFDVHNFDKEKQINIFDKAKQKIQDKKVREEEKQAKKKLPRKDDGRLDLFSYQENQNNENNNKQDDTAKNENNIEKRLNIFKEIVNDENKNTEDKLKELKLGKDILETSLMDTDTKIKKLNTPSNKNYELWKDFVNIGASREEFEKFQKENEQTLNNLQKERKENSNILDYIHDSIKKLEENDKEQINTTNDEREQGEETGQPAYENERLGENTRQENEQDDERGMDRSSVRNRSNDKTRSGRVSELSYKQEDELKKNQNNWHRTEDGDDIPQTAKARFNANIKAIELMKNIFAEDRNATEEEKKILSKFSGWGGLGTFFTEGNDGYEALQRTLSEDEFNDASLSLNSAFYTPDDIIDKLWQVVKNLGFKGGNILEGSAGVGNILSRIPQKINERSDIQAVEIDNISGNILKLLYPDAQVEIKGFEKTNIKPASVDLAITNVPFVTGLKVWDDSNTDISKKFSDIHNFCIAKNVRCLREGGIGIFITSKGTLDGGTELTQWITSNKGGNADFVGAFRLNNETFKGTKVTSDIIVVRKRVKDRINNDAINLSSIAKLRDVKIEIDDVVKTYPLMYNSYFVEHPENMGGRMFFNSEKGETFRPTSNGLFASENINQEDRLNKWSESFLKQDKIDIIKEDEETKDYENTTEREGVLTTDSKGNICSSYRGKAIPIGVKVNDKINGYKADECLQDYKNIKDSLQTVLDGQSNDKDDTDEQLKRKQDKLNDVYDKFIRKYGYLSNNRKIRFLKEDVDFPAMMALEDVKEEVSINEKTGKTSTLYKVKKEKVFSQRVIRKENNTIPKNVQDAVVTSIYERGFIDCDIIAEQLGKSKKQVEDEIIDKGLGFINPTTDSIEVSYEYLSGNVRDKLEIAKQNNTDGRFDKNIKALEEILPVWIPAHLINIQIGASWCPSRVFYEYVKDKYEMEQKDFLLTYANGMWITQNSRFGHTHKDREGGVYSKQLEKQIYASDIFLELLNNRTIAVQKTETYYEENIKRTRTITDQQATQMCVAKAEEMKEDFRDWINQKLRNDESLKSEVENIYNNRFNNLVAKEIDDKFLPEHFKGSSIAINLYSHQKKAVMRALTEPLMLAHEVGTGKTFTMITTAMEMKRLGMADKPMIVVQNATLEQFVSQAKRLYPNAHILSPTSNDRTKNGRKYFYSKTKYGNWDFVVVPQSMFNTIPDDPNEKESYTAEKIEEKEQALANFELQRENNLGDSLAQRNDDIAISQLKKDIEKLKNSLTEKGVSAKELKAQAEMKENIKAKVERQLSRKKDEDISTLKDMGIDALFVDEAHEYKRLGFETTMQRVRGIDKSSSQRAVALFLKTKEILKRKGGKNVVFATGTPISNTAAEIWTFMKYLLSKDIMQESGIYYFDDFVRNFGKVAQSLEFTTSGKYRENTRFLGYNGLPELIRMWASCADTVLADENKELDDKIPQTELGGKTARDIFLDQTPSLMRIMKVVKEKLNEFEAMSGKEKKENSHIPLVMYGIAKRAAIDPRLVDADAIDEPYSKTNQTVNEILKSLEETKSYKGTVAVFCDRFRRKVNDIAKEFNLFEDMRKKLIAKGVNEEEIFVMKSGMTDTAKAKVFEKVNKGEIRVIMGSTQLLGVGVNIQERLHTLIHMDAPDRPMDYEQRNGRILRQGNLHRQMNKPVRILRFGVKKSLDVTAYQRLKTKQSFIRSIMDGKQRLKNILINREEDEINEEGMFDNPVAMLSGSQYALELNQAKRDYTKYKNKEKEYLQNQLYATKHIPENNKHIKLNKQIQEKNEIRLKELQKYFPQGSYSVIEIAKVKCNNLMQAEKVIKDVINKNITDRTEELRNDYTKESAEIQYNIKLDEVPIILKIVLSKEGKFERGQIKTVVHKSIKITSKELNMEDVPSFANSVTGALAFLTDDVISGKKFKNDILQTQNNIIRYEKENKSLQETLNRDFEYKEQLEQSKQRVDELTDLMNEEIVAIEKEEERLLMEAGVGGADLDKMQQTNFESEEDEEKEYHKTEKENEPLTEEDIILRDAIIDKLQKLIGKDNVITDSDDAQRIIDTNNDDNSLKGNKVYHGSPYQFTEFDHSKMGTGEGRQVFGWGSYVSEIKDIGRHYAQEKRYRSIIKIRNRNGSFDEYDITHVDGFDKDRLSAILKAYEMVCDYDTILQARKAAQYYADRSTDWLDFWQNVCSVLKEHRKSDFSLIHKYGTKNLYTVEIPDDNGRNYLYWEKRVRKDFLRKIAKNLYENKDVIFWVENSTATDKQRALEKGFWEDYLLRHINNGEDLYNLLESVLGNDKKASGFLSKLGIIGMSYPAGFLHGGNKEGKRNYVIFKEKNLKIIDHIKLFKTKDGNAYGFTANGKIYIDTNIAKADTPIHEYTHLWAKALRENNPKEWQNIVELMKQETFIWDKVKKMYPELKKNENIADEVLAMYSGENGLKKLKEEVAKIKNNNKQNIFDKAMALQAINNIKKALEKFWKSVASFFNVHFTNTQDLADTILADFLNGVNPNEYVQEPDSKIQSHRTDDKRVKNIIDNIDYERELQNSTLGKPAKKDNEDIPKNLLRKITDKLAVISTKEGLMSFADDYHSLRKDEDKVVKKMQESDKNFRLPKSIYEQQIAANTATNGQIFLFEQQKFAPLLRKIQQICKENNLTQKESEQYLMFLFYPERTAYTIYNRYNAIKEANEKKEKANPRYKKEFEKVKMYIKSLSEGERKQAEEKAMKIFNAKYQDLPFENNDELNEERQKCINEQLARKAAEKYRDTELYTLREKNEVKEINNVLIPLSKNDKISGFAGEDDMFNTPLYRTIVEKYFKEEKDNFTVTTINPYQITEKFKELVGKDNAEELKQMVKDINSYSLDKALDAGSISEEEYEAYKQNDYYVPLRGWDKDNEIDVFGGDISFQRINPQTKGRKSTADTPLKYLFEIACRQIYESNDKKAKLSLINFYYKYRDILIGENSVAYWTWTDKDGEERHSFERPQRKDVLADSLKFNIMDKEYDRIHSNELKKHLFEFKNGKTTYRLYLKSTYLVNILNSEKNNLPDSMKLIMKGVQNISRTTRYMSAMMTSKNPAFATANFFRDFSSVYFLDERTKDDFPHFNKVFTKNLLNMKTTAKVIFNAKNTYRKENNETLSAKDKELLSLYNQWLHFGGLSGYSYFLQNLDDDFQRRYKEMIKTKGRKVYEGISPLYFEWFNKLSEFTENQVRFAAFRTYLETNPNITVEEAVFRSKEVTLNFSRKGWGTRTFGYFFPFFNATCQGLIKLARLLKYNPLRLIRSFSVFLALGMVDAVLSMYFGGYDDDKDDKEKKRYLQINDYVSERNIILFNTVKIPIPQELYLPFTMGVSLIKAQQGILSGTEASYRILSALGQLLPDEMGSTLGAFAKYDKVHDEITFNDHPFLAVVNALSPGILSPVMDYQTNRDFMGGRILPKEYQKGKIAQAGRYDDYKTYGIYQDAAFVWNNLWNIWHTTKIGQKAGEPISWNRKYYEDLVSQSNKFVDKNGRMFDLSTISPAALQYYVGSYASGLNNILTKVGDMVAGRKEVKAENIPIIDRLAVKHNEHYSLYKKMSLVYDILDNQTTDKKTQDLRDIAQMYGLDTQRFDKVTQSKNAEVVRRYNRKKKELQRLSTEIKILKIAGGVKNKKEIDKKLNEQEVIYNDILDGWIAE